MSYHEPLLSKNEIAICYFKDCAYSKIGFQLFPLFVLQMSIIDLSKCVVLSADFFNITGNGAEICEVTKKNMSEANFFRNFANLLLHAVPSVAKAQEQEEM